MRLAGRCAIVTGGGSGIGRASAIALAKEGADVAVADLDLGRAEETAAVIQQSGRRSLALRTDVSNKAAVTAMAEDTRTAFGKIDILLNNAGILRNNALHLMSEKEWDLVMNVHAKGTFLCTQAVLPDMMERGYGRIINISSIAARVGTVGSVNYCAAKAAIVAFTKAAAKELAGYHITVNTILPGYIDTPLICGIPETDLRDRLTDVALGRKGRPDELASVVVFLSSEESSYMTGAALEVSGGMFI